MADGRQRPAGSGLSLLVPSPDSPTTPSGVLAEPSLCRPATLRLDMLKNLHTNGPLAASARPGTSGRAESSLPLTACGSPQRPQTARAKLGLSGGKRRQDIGEGRPEASGGRERVMRYSLSDAVLETRNGEMRRGRRCQREGEMRCNEAARRCACGEAVLRRRALSRTIGLSRCAQDMQCKWS